MNMGTDTSMAAGDSLFKWLLKMTWGVAGVQGFGYLLTQVLGIRGSWSYIYLVLTLIDLAWLLFLLPLLTLLGCGCLRQQGAPRRRYIARLDLIGVQVLLGAIEMVHFFQLYS